MQPAIVRRVEARLRGHLLRLRAAAVARDRRARRSRCGSTSTPTSSTFSQWPPPVTSLRSSDGGSFMFIDEDVDVAVVVEVAEGAAAAGVRRGDAGARFLDQLLEPAVAEVAEHQPRRLERIGRQRPLDFRDRRCRSPGTGREAVVVEIDDAGAPADVARLDADARADRDVVEVALAVVAIEHVGVVGEVRLEDVEVAVEIVVADARRPCRPAPCRPR